MVAFVDNYNFNSFSKNYLQNSTLIRSLNRLKIIEIIYEITKIKVHIDEQWVASLHDLTSLRNIRYFLELNEN